ncbi:hypothetical protein HUT18_18310 [Streptomyces sp. NA04227]|uniref:hypothetical protein n=1 Tax=Streptomyces sp. NA04227 TaxID=2742136 RepID=UPI0015921D16|nr:hypothetical protein [Streptomyces sp. NA04227]QKW08042.1 hypothetical protein HUT18_18310 [Streptomyces sp. NA04227]
MRKPAAAMMAALSAASVLALGIAPANASDDVPSDYSNEQLAENVVIEDVPGDPVTQADEDALKAAMMARSAFGSTAIDPFALDVFGVSVNVPKGCFLNHKIEGSGKKVGYQMAGVDCVGPAATVTRFCNSRLEFHYADTSGKTYKIERGPVNKSCSTAGVPTFKIEQFRILPEYGKTCAHLYVNGKRKAVQCHFITK